MAFKFIYCTLIYLIISTQGLLIPVTTPHNSRQKQCGQHANNDVVVVVESGHAAMWRQLLSQGAQWHGSGCWVRVHGDVVAAVELGHAAKWQWLSSQGTWCYVLQGLLSYAPTSGTTAHMWYACIGCHGPGCHNSPVWITIYGNHHILFVRYALCVRTTGTICVVLWSMYAPSCKRWHHLMSWQASSCSNEWRKPRGVALFKYLYYIVLRSQSQLCLQSKIVYSSRLVQPLFSLVTNT
jgi:hypothetical protein